MRCNVYFQHTTYPRSNGCIDWKIRRIPLVYSLSGTFSPILVGTGMAKKVGHCGKSVG